MRPRSQYGLIHGELGPDHVLVDRPGQPVLTDIEGLMFFDVEWSTHSWSLHRPEFVAATP